MINQRIWELWDRNPDLRWVRNKDNQRVERIPKFVNCPRQEHEMVVLGVNPSFPEKPGPATEQFFRDNNIDWAEASDWIKSGLAENYDAHGCGLMAEVHRIAQVGYKDHKRYRWFGEFDALAEKAGMKNGYYHADVFLPLAEGVSRLPGFYGDFQKKSFHSQKDSRELAFVRSQVEICYELVKTCRPRVIVARYARAADVFLAYLLSTNGGKGENMGRRFEPIQGLSSLKKATVRTEWADEVHLLRFSQLRKKGGSFCSQVPDIAASIRKLTRYRDETSGNS
ncbi:MAG: hypothetical protein ACO1QS_20765 [Verrucomicrobiota bacterium]